MSRTVLERIAEGEAAIARRLMAGDPVPPDWLEYLSRLRRAAVKQGLLPDLPTPVSPAPARYSPGCLFDYAPKCGGRSLLRCVAHGGCPRVVILWRDGLLAEMFRLEKLVGAARHDGEAECLARRRAAG